MTLKVCGRIDDHEPHTWEGTPQRWAWRITRRVYSCPGHITVEGGHRGVR